MIVDSYEPVLNYKNGGCLPPFFVCMMGKDLVGDKAA
jgi:hypothetical protein